MARKPKTAADAPQQEVAVVAYKGFDKSLSCRGFQYEFGKTYEHDGPPVRCGAPGFHSCENPLDIWSYYPPANGNRFASVEAAGNIDRAEGEDTKIASAKITITAELHISDLITRAVKWIASKASGDAITTGNWANAATTGNGANAATTGERANAATTGNWANAATTGNWANAATTGKNAVAAALGANATAKASAGGAVVMVARDDRGVLLHIFASKVGENGIEPDVEYRLSAVGLPEKVEN